MTGSRSHHQTSALERTFRYNRLWLQFLLAGAKVPTGQTPKEVIWTKNKATLYRYAPQGEIRFPVPLLLVYALIDRPFILDLIPGNSFVEYLVEQGFDVYLLDWGIPDDEDDVLTFDHYVFDYLAEAVRQALRTSHAEAVTLFGACIRGPAQRYVRGPLPRLPLRNLILYATPIDCSPKYLGWFRWITAPGVHPEGLGRPLGTCHPNSSGARPAAQVDH